MAVNNTTKPFAKMEFPLAMQRQDAFALDPPVSGLLWRRRRTTQRRTRPHTSVRSSLWSWMGLPPRTPSGMPPVISPRWGAAAVDIATDSEVSEMLSEVFPTDNT